MDEYDLAVARAQPNWCCVLCGQWVLLKGGLLFKIAIFCNCNSFYFNLKVHVRHISCEITAKMRINILLSYTISLYSCQSLGLIISDLSNTISVVTIIQLWWKLLKTIITSEAIKRILSFINKVLCYTRFVTWLIIFFCNEINIISITKNL